MTEESLRCKTEQEIRARFRCAPDYYLQAKLEKRRALAGLEQQAGANTEPGGQADHVEKPIEPATLPEPGSLDLTAFAPERTQITAPAPKSRQATAPAPKPRKAASPAPESTKTAPPPAPKRTKRRLRREVPDFALPGFEILDAALAESDGPDTTPAEPVGPEDPGLTQQAILAVALEGYSNWPFLPDAEPERASQAGSELERKLARVLASEPELELLLDSDSELDLELEPHPGRVSDNVTVADFRHRAPRTVRVVSVVMDRKRPNMVRVARESTRLAS